MSKAIVWFIHGMDPRPVDPKAREYERRRIREDVKRVSRQRGPLVAKVAAAMTAGAGWLAAIRQGRRRVE